MLLHTVQTFRPEKQVSQGRSPIPAIVPPCSTPCGSVRGASQHLITAAHTQNRRVRSRQLFLLQLPDRFDASMSGLPWCFLCPAAPPDPAFPSACTFPHNEPPKPDDFPAEKIGKIEMWADESPRYPPAGFESGAQTGGKTVLIVDGPRAYRERPQHRQACLFFQHGQARPQKFHAPRNLLTTSPLMRAHSSGASKATVPYSCANYAAPVDVSHQNHRCLLGHPMLTMSPSRRLISAGLPALR